MPSLPIYYLTICTWATPSINHAVASIPCHSIHMGPFPAKKSLLVCVLRNSPGVIICRLRKIFATHRRQEQATSDNGPNLVSAEIKDFISYCGIHHQKVTHYWPPGQCNGRNIQSYGGKGRLDRPCRRERLEKGVGHLSLKLSSHATCDD